MGIGSVGPTTLGIILAENRMGIGSVGPTTAALLVATDIGEIAFNFSEHKKS